MTIRCTPCSDRPLLPLVTFTATAIASVSLRNDKSHVSLLSPFSVLNVSTTPCSSAATCAGVALLESPSKLIIRKDSNSFVPLHGTDSSTTTFSIVSTLDNATEERTKELKMNVKSVGGKHISQRSVLIVIGVTEEEGECVVLLFLFFDSLLPLLFPLFLCLLSFSVLPLPPSFLVLVLSRSFLFFTFLMPLIP